MNLKKDLISVIMPTYNRCSFLQKRIDEFYNQTYKNCELIIINDASNDGTKEFLSKLNDSRIKIINLDKNSHNVSIPRNIGISVAEGEFICHCDDDDIQLSTKLETLYNTLISAGPEYIMAYGDRIARYPDHDELSAVPGWNASIWGVGNGQYLYRNCYDKIHLVFCKRACDWQLCKFLIQQGKFAYVNKVMVIVMWHGGNRSLDNVKCQQPTDVEYYKDYYNKNYGRIIVE